MQPRRATVLRASTIRKSTIPPVDDYAVDLAQYASRNWVIPHRQWSCHEMVQRACGIAGFSPHAVAEASDFAVLLALVSAGVGVALVPQLTVAQLPRNVVLRPLVTPVWRHDFVVTRQSAEADPGIRRIIDLFAAAAATLVPPAPVRSPDL